jgi:Flp pilus assembly protein TadG
MVIMVYGTVEVASSIFLKQTLTSAAHEGALTGMKQNAEETDIIDRVNLILTARNISGCNVQVLTDGTGFDSLIPGDMFRVQIQKGQTSQFTTLTNVTVIVATQRQ